MKAQWLRYLIRVSDVDTGELQNVGQISNRQTAIAIACKRHGFVLDLLTPVGYGFKIIADFRPK